MNNQIPLQTGLRGLLETQPVQRKGTASSRLNREKHIQELAGKSQWQAKSSRLRAISDSIDMPDVSHNYS